MSCGKKMCGTSAKSGGNKNLLRTYGCNNHRARHGSTCRTKNINADYVENAAKEIIFQSIYQSFSQGNLKKTVFDILIKKEEATKKHLEQLLLSSQQKSDSLVTMIINTNDALLKKKYEDTLTSILQLEGIQKNKKLDVDKKIAKYTAMKTDKLSIATLSKDTLFSDYDTSKKLMRLFIEEIQVTNSNVKFIFKN